MTRPLQKATDFVDAVQPELKESILEWQNWLKFKRNIHDFFLSQEYQEINTPTLVPTPGTEVYLAPFQVSPSNDFLVTSPEIHLKKAMARHKLVKVFEIRSCFRNDLASPTHSREFTMLEWYTASDNLDSLVQFLNGLLKHTAGLLSKSPPPPISTIPLTKLFKEKTGIILTPQSSIEELLKDSTTQGLQDSRNDWDDLFHLIWLDKIEQSIDSTVPLVVTGYPPHQTPMAKIAQDGWAERFELFWEGLEIGNAYNELNDAKELECRMIEDNERRRALGLREMPLDTDFLDSIHALPECIGMAIGLERLFMAASGINDIRHLSPFYCEKND